MSISLNNFADSRASEIRELLKDIQKPNSNCLDFQCMPIHLRRRSSSRKFTTLNNRKINKISKRKFSKKRNKNISRKKRRAAKPDNPNRLATHLWHAKRFHIIKIYNFTIPFCSTTKLFRPTHRAIKNTVCLQDISFINLITITGEKNGILSLLSRFLKCIDNTENVNENSKNPYLVDDFLENQEYSILFYKDVSDYRSLMGPVLVSFSSVNEESIFFIWSHHLLTIKIFQELQSNNASFKIEVSHNLTRFRLLGPLSFNLVLTAINYDDLSENLAENIFSNYQILNGNILESLTNLSSLKKQNHSVTKDIQTKKLSILDCEKMSKLFQSPNKAVNSLLSHSNKSSIEILLNKTQKNINFPVFVISRNKRNVLNGFCDYGNGFDIILPRIYSARFFNFLVLHGAKVGGLREYNYIALETFQRKYPEDFPDVVSLKDFDITYENISSRKIIKRIKKMTVYNKSVNDIIEKDLGVDMTSFRILSEIDQNVNYPPSTFVFIGMIAVQKGIPVKLQPIYTQKTENKDEYKIIGYVLDGDISLSIGKGLGKGIIQIQEWNNLQGKNGKRHAFLKFKEKVFFKFDIFISSSLYI